MAWDQGYFNHSQELVRNLDGRASRPAHSRVARIWSYGSRHGSWHETAGLHCRTVPMAHLRWKWEFQFEPKQILTPGGATSVVPAVTNFPDWAQLCMLAAGPFANVFTGVLAL